MKLAGAAVLLLLAGRATAPPLDPSQFHFLRTISVGPGSQHAACAVLDATTYAHAGASLDDVRLFSGAEEVPYALTMSNTSYASPAGEPAKVLNLGVRSGHVDFDLAMPARAYSSVDLDLKGENFVATAKISGSNQIGRGGTDLGTLTLFDLTARKLGRDTQLRLAESTFAYLHVDLQVSALGDSHPHIKVAPSMVAGASVPPSREAQTLYTVVARSETLEQDGTRTQAKFTLPARVPVERVRVVLAEGDRTNFSRAIVLEAHPVGAPEEELEEIAGQIARVRLDEDGSQLRRDDLTMAATLGANSRQAAKVQVSIENDDDRPLAVKAVVLEMRQRKLCFAVPAGPVKMLYGNAELGAPRYDFSRIFAPSQQTRAATLGPEQVNADFVAPVDRRSFLERHPRLVWVALLAVLTVLGLVALRSGSQLSGKRAD